MHRQIEEGVLQSFSPPESLFGHTYNALCIPPYPMKTVLHLGWGVGVNAHLIDKIWPVGTEHTAVDIKEIEGGYEPQMFWKAQAWEFVQNSGKVYDYVIVDLYKGRHIPDFVFSEKFVDELSKITGKMLCINLTFYKWKDFEIYGKHFVPDACKTANEDKVMMMLPKELFNGEEKA